MPDDLIEFEELENNEVNYQRASSIPSSGSLSPISTPRVPDRSMQDANQLLTGRGLPMSEPERNWTQQNLPISQDVLETTKPYFDLAQNLGREFKEGHEVKFKEDKFLKKNPNATPGDIANRKAQVERNAEFVPQAKDLREAYKNVDMSTASDAIRNEFNRRYEAIRKGAGRTEESELERLIPKDHPLRSKLDPMTGALRDPSTGLYADMKKVGEEPNTKNVLILGGTGVGKMDTKQLLADIGQGAGGIPGNYKQADQLASLLKSELDKEGVKMETTGHSLGGGMANYTGLKNGIPSTCFNAAALGPGTRNDIPKENLNNAKDLAVHVNVRGELISDIGTSKTGNLRNDIESKVYAPKQKVQKTIQDIKNSTVAQGLKSAANTIKTTANTVSESPVGQTISTGVTSVRDALRKGATDIKNSSVGQSVSNAVSTTANSIKETAKDVRTALGNSSVGKQVSNATSYVGNKLNKLGDKINKLSDDIKESKIGKFVRNDVGLPKGLGLPHQYGQSYEMDVPEAKNCAAKHNTKAIEKGYKSYDAAFQQQQQQSQNVGRSRGIGR